MKLPAWHLFTLPFALVTAPGALCMKWALALHIYSICAWQGQLIERPPATKDDWKLQLRAVFVWCVGIKECRAPPHISVRPQNCSQSCVCHIQPVALQQRRHQSAAGSVQCSCGVGSWHIAVQPMKNQSRQVQISVKCTLAYRPV